MYEDPIVDNVRKTREYLAGKYDFDVGAIFEDIRKRQGALGKRLVCRQKKSIAQQAAASNRDSATLHPGR